MRNPILLYLSEMFVFFWKQTLVRLEFINSTTAKIFAYISYSTFFVLRSIWKEQRTKKIFCWPAHMTLPLVTLVRFLLFCFIFQVIFRANNYIRYFVMTDTTSCLWRMTLFIRHHIMVTRLLRLEPLLSKRWIWLVALHISCLNSGNA